MKSFFPDMPERIKYEGKESRNPLAFKWYDPGRVIMDKTMEEHLRFAVAYWHTFKNAGADPFGDPTMDRAWNRFDDPMDRAYATCDAAFEFFNIINVPFYCFHDRDLAPEGETFAESCENLECLAIHAMLMVPEPTLISMSLPMELLRLSTLLRQPKSWVVKTMYSGVGVKDMKY